MAKICEYIKRLALAFWLGEMLFFAFVFAPRVFKVLPRPQAAELQAAIFPAYFTVGVICALAILLSFLAKQMISGTGFFSKKERLSYKADNPKIMPLIITVVAGCIFAYCLLWLTPQIIDLQKSIYGGTATEATHASFGFLHRLSTTLNAIVLLLLLVLVAVL